MGSNHYPGKEVAIVNKFSGKPKLSNYSLSDVVRSFQSIHRYGDFIGVHENQLIQNDAYTGINNHFQGIQRLRDGQRFIISGGNIKDSHAHLFIAKLSNYGLVGQSKNSRIVKATKIGPVGSNVLIKEKIPRTDVLEDIICLETGKYWHAGGISLSGDILAVPLENRDDNRSVIAFYNLRNIKKIERLRNMILRTSGKCGAVAIAQLTNGNMLCVSWSDDDDKADRFEFYISKDELGVFKRIGGVNFSQVKGKPKGKSKFQSIQILQQDDDRLFLLATQNTNKLAPKFNGINEALLFEIVLKPKLSLRFIMKRRFANGGDYYNFAAATGAYVNEQKELALYSGHHWRKSGSIRFAEFFQQRPNNIDKIKTLKEARIELYEDKNFKKRRIVIYGKKLAALKKYDWLFVHGIYFDDKISSIKYVLPEGIRYRLYDDSNYNNGNKKKNYLTLVGTGKLEKVKDLKSRPISGLKFNRNFDDKISSSRFVK